MTDVISAPTLRARVAIVGGGIAGIWVALKLAKLGVDSILIDYRAADRGGTLGSSARSVGAVNTAPFERSDFRSFMDELGIGQVHPTTVDLVMQHLREELAELQSYGSFKPIKLGVAVAGGNAGPLLESLHQRYHQLGGRSLDAWITRLVTDAHGCCGLQYQQADRIGKIIAPVVVIATGGYAGLFDGSVKTNNHGTFLGRFLHGGGIATNLEFVFKHGYGKPDLGALTPTEELPGAEVYDDDKVHVEWLERELYEGRGTANHLAAFKHWRNNRERNFFIDLKYRGLYQKVQAINAACAANAEAAIEGTLRALLEQCPQQQRLACETLVLPWVASRTPISYERFNLLKRLFDEVASGDVFRVRQITYFSMGGIAHEQCLTNLPNVFVTGEAMHDFGAHRVGGLPWGLYLAAGRLISDRISQLLQQASLPERDFELLRARAVFDANALRQIRVDLFRYQECNLNIGGATKFIAEMRSKRRALFKAGRILDDAVAWTIVAEAVTQASLRRTESRGCFYRSDHPMSVERMKRHFSCTSYDAQDDVVTSRLIRIADLPSTLSGSRDEIEYRIP